MESYQTWKTKFLTFLLKMMTPVPPERRIIQKLLVKLKVMKLFEVVKREASVKKLPTKIG